MDTQHHGVTVRSFPAAYAWLMQHARFSRPGEAQHHSLLVVPRASKAVRHTFGVRDGGDHVDVWHISEGGAL